MGAAVRAGDDGARVGAGEVAGRDRDLGMTVGELKERMEGRGGNKGFGPWSVVLAPWAMAP